MAFKRNPSYRIKAGKSMSPNIKTKKPFNASMAKKFRAKVAPNPRKFTMASDQIPFGTYTVTKLEGAIQSSTQDDAAARLLRKREPLGVMGRTGVRVGGKAKKRKNRTRVPNVHKVPEQTDIYVGAPNIFRQRQDTVWKTTSGVVTRGLTRVTTGIRYFIKDHTTVARPKWLREVMKERIRTTVLLRDDSENIKITINVPTTATGTVGTAGYIPAISGASGNYVKTDQRTYAESGINLKGVWYPGNDIFHSDKTAFATNGFYNFTGTHYTPAFKGQDYAACLFLDAVDAFFASIEPLTPLAADPVTVKDVDYVFPLLRRRMTLDITNRSSYTNTLVTIYIVRQKDNDSVNNVWNSIYSSGGNSIADSLKVTPYTKAVLSSDGGNTDKTFQINQLHLEATPFMAQNFKDRYDVVKVHTFTLAPSDIMEYTLSLGMDGFKYKRWQNSPAQHSYWQGDYQAFITFQGADKYTVGYRKGTSTAVPASGAFGTEGYTAATTLYGVTYLSQMAVDGCVAPAEISVRTKVSMDVAYDDYYDLKVPADKRKMAWDGVNTSISSHVDRIQTLFQSVTPTRRRQVTDRLTVMPNSIIDADKSISTVTANASGYFIQVESDKQYRSFDTSSDKTSNVVNLEEF